jgi:hypothetical protein
LELEPEKEEGEDDESDDGEKGEEDEVVVPIYRKVVPNI